jgi:diguanylate cyclase (GGDEF)-like protein/putative nucleotidyltransferase with HDIG domain
MPAQSLEWPRLGLAPRAAAVAIQLFGLATLLWNLARWRHPDPGLFLGYLAVATAAAALRIRLPGLAGSLSLDFFFVLICIPQLSLAETLLIACAGALTQDLIYLKPRRIFLILFNVAVAAIATAAAAALYTALASSGSLDRSPLLLVIAAMALFAATTLPPALLLSLAAGRGFWDCWRENYFWTFPHYLAGGGAAGLLGLIGSRSGWEMALLIVPVLFWMHHSYRYYREQLQEERRQVRELGNLHFRTIEALALAIEGHDPTKHGHLRRVTIYVTEIGREMGLSEPELQALHAAAMLHDIGKLAVPEHIITKPGKLTEMEFERIKVHPVAGAELLEQVQFPYPVAAVVRAHHEKWDGTGYPAGLKGTEIPVGARILAAVDCLDALVSDRYHRRAVSLEQAMNYLRAESGKSFDPAVIAILDRRYLELEQKVQQALQRDAELRTGGGLLVSRPAATLRSATFLARIAAARQEEQQFFQLARELADALSLEQTLAACADRIEAMCPRDMLVIFLRQDRRLRAELARGAHAEFARSLEVAWGQGVAGWVAERRRAVLNGDPAGDFASCPGLVARQFASALAAPIEGVTELIGVIVLYSRSANAFSVDHLRVLSGVAARAGTAIENAIKYSQAEQSATTDPLTGLANARSLFLRLDGELARAKRHREAVTVLVCDLDRFKQLNDLHGHMEGNRALRAVAQALKRQCREYDFVARMGGDEFVIVLPSHRLESVEAKIEQLQEAAMRAVAEIAGGSGLGISIGYASFPDDGEDAESLLAAADRRMYRMKEQSAARAAELAAEELRRLGERLGPRRARP